MNLVRRYTGSMENRMETAMVYWGHLGIMENKMETTGLIGLGRMGLTMSPRPSKWDDVVLLCMADGRLPVLCLGFWSKLSSAGGGLGRARTLQSFHIAPEKFNTIFECIEDLSPKVLNPKP